MLSINEKVYVVDKVLDSLRDVDLQYYIEEYLYDTTNLKEVAEDDLDSIINEMVVNGQLELDIVRV